MRLFIAIELPENVKDISKTISQNAQFPGLRYVKPEHMHLTLSFIGEIDDGKVDDVIKKLKSVEFEPFNLQTSGIGIFPSDKRVRILWIGLEKNEQFLKLQKDIRDLFSHKDKFMPHFTIARASKIIFDDEMSIKKKIGKIKYAEASFRVDKFVLYKSVLTPQGPIHEKIEGFNSH